MELRLYADGVEYELKGFTEVISLAWFQAPRRELHEN